jgi:pimeloyl-ACP methyl ester carboxylesterase
MGDTLCASWALPLLEMSSNQRFAEPEHEAFLRFGAVAGKALLVHGDPGTPAELRPLARRLHQQGWTVHAPLLPSDGPEAADLGGGLRADAGEMLASARACLDGQPGPTLVVGCGLGGALALLEAARQPAQGLVLLAPFPSPRGGTQPTPRALHELQRLGRDVLAAAPRVSCPTLGLGPATDAPRPRAQVESLRRRLGGPVQWIEVAAAGPSLLDPEEPSWPLVCGAVLRFAARILPGAVRDHLDPVSGERRAVVAH